MSVPIQPLDLVKFSVWCTDGNQASVNTYWYGCNTVVGLGVTDLEAATEFDLGMAPLYKVNLNNNAVYNGVQCQILRAGKFFVSQTANASTGPGTGGAVSLPRQICGLISLKTDKAGPAYRGRVYLPFFPTAADVGDGSMNTGTQANVLAVGALAHTINTLGTGGNTSHIVYSIKHHAARGVQPLADPVTVVSVKPQWATQRKRGFFGRPNVSPF